MKVLVTGSGGFLGRHIVEALVKHGHAVRALVRPFSTIPSWSDKVEIVRADLRAPGDLGAALDGIDAIVHAAAGTSGSDDAQFASTVVATEHLLKAIRASRVKRIILISSFVLYDWDRASRLIDEETPTAKEIYELGGYTIAKVWQERIVRRSAAANGLLLTILRPGFIWGEGRAEIAGMGRRFGRVFLMFGPFTRLPLVHVVNCADCVVAALENPAAVGETFNVVDDDDISVWRYVREFARRSGLRGIFLPAPYVCGLALAELAGLVSRGLFGQNGKLPSLLAARRFRSQFRPLRFPNRKLVAKLGWRSPLTFEQALEASYPDPESKRASSGARARLDAGNDGGAIAKGQALP
jgi:nucleoside-diphosphate-sugar epimerase